MQNLAQPGGWLRFRYSESQTCWERFLACVALIGTDLRWRRLITSADRIDRYDVTAGDLGPMLIIRSRARFALTRISSGTSIWY